MISTAFSHIAEEGTVPTCSFSLFQGDLAEISCDRQLHVFALQLTNPLHASIQIYFFFFLKILFGLVNFRCNSDVNVIYAAESHILTAWAFLKTFLYQSKFQEFVLCDGWKYFVFGVFFFFFFARFIIKGFF